MKYVKSCVFIAMLAGIGYACHGDLNGDGGYNVLDIVYLANCILNADCSLYYIQGCDRADVNSDGNYNILDIVTLANCVLADNCGD
jgi:predicted metal-binding protein